MADQHPLDALLPEICQLLDTCREDFIQRGLWTEWDQSVRDRIAAYNLNRVRLAAAVGDPSHSMRTAGVAIPQTPKEN